MGEVSVADAQSDLSLNMPQKSYSVWCFWGWGQEDQGSLKPAPGLGHVIFLIQTAIQSYNGSALG